MSGSEFVAREAGAGAFMPLGSVHCQTPSSIPSVAGADSAITARLAKSLSGHPGRKARFLAGPLQELRDLIRELRMALFPGGRVKGKSLSSSRPKDSALRAGLLLNGVAFVENNHVVWPVLVLPCRCRTSGEAGKVSVLCLRCGGLVSSARREASQNIQIGPGMCGTRTCSSCRQPIGEDDLICEACGDGHHWKTQQTGVALCPSKGGLHPHGFAPCAMLTLPRLGGANVYHSLGFLPWRGRQVSRRS
eukprot:symbB.v1.2.011244.t1/scaffold751.1/size165343/15